MGSFSEGLCGECSICLFKRASERAELGNASLGKAWELPSCFRLPGGRGRGRWVILVEGELFLKLCRLSVPLWDLQKCCERNPALGGPHSAPFPGPLSKFLLDQVLIPSVLACCLLQSRARAAAASLQ